MSGNKVLLIIWKSAFKRRSAEVLLTGKKVRVEIVREEKRNSD